jgi:exportin-1
VQFFAVSILQDAINARWKTFQPTVAQGIKDFVIKLIIDISQNAGANQELLKKLDQALVAILKQQGPAELQKFLPSFLAASMRNESVCRNNMMILKLLSEEVFDRKDTMVRAKAQKLKDSMCELFGGVFKLCQEVLSKSQDAPLLIVTLETLLNFLGWIPIGYVFTTSLIENLVGKFLNPPGKYSGTFRNLTVQCLTEIAEIELSADTPEGVEMMKKQVAMFTESMKVMTKIVPPGTNLSHVYQTAGEKDQEFVQHLGTYLSTYLKTHGKMLENGRLPVLEVALKYLVGVSRVENIEIFKIALEYWHTLAKDLFEDNQGGGGGGALMLGAPSGGQAARRQFYAGALTELRSIMVERMAKPEEVLVVECEGEVIREQMKDTAGLEQYKHMRETLVYLTHLDYNGTQLIMKNKLDRQVDGTEYSWTALNTLCWAIGSITGAMSSDREKKFLVEVIKELLGLCENRVGKNHKAIIASNIMYVVGQYPRFLREHWKFLKTVVNKLFEFMHEKHEGVQDMACDTFIKIAKQCKKEFVKMQVMEQRPFVSEILEPHSFYHNIMDLEKHQVHTVYEAIGHMIYAEEDVDKRRNLIGQLMHHANAKWAALIQQATADPTVLQRSDSLDLLIDILRTNVSACSTIGNDFIMQLQVIYMNMLDVYKRMSQNIAAAIASGSAGGIQPLIKQMRVVKKEILRLLGTWVSMSTDPKEVTVKVIPTLLPAVLGDYQASNPDARDAEVLTTMAKIVRTLRECLLQPLAPGGQAGAMFIFANTFTPTIQMISGDFESYPEHRVGFYDLMEAIVRHCFPAFRTLSIDQWKQILQVTYLGFHNRIRSVAETSLNILHKLLETVAENHATEFAQQFFHAFYLPIMEEVLSVATDSIHYSETKEHAAILAYMFLILEQGAIKTPFNPAAPDNVAYVTNHIGTKLKAAFPHLATAQLQLAVRGFFSYNKDEKMFKEHLRDFLVETKEQVGEDVSNIYIVDRQQALLEAERLKRENLARITSGQQGMM